MLKIVLFISIINPKIILLPPKDYVYFSEIYIMWWNKMLYLGACLLLCLFSCNSQTDNAMAFQNAEPLQINRFDRTLLRWLEHPADSAALDSLRSSYRPMLELTGKGILNVQSPEQEEFFPRLTNYYGEPTLRSLYRDAINSFDSTSDIEKTMGQAFAFLESIFPERIVPTLYMHVSGFNQNILVSDSALSLSIDKYLGEDYPLYHQFFPDYERAKMTRDFASVDYLLGWLMSEFPFEGRENVLLDRMIYSGKIYYILSLCLPDRPIESLLGYNEEAARWCHANEKMLWKTIVSRKHLYTPDITTTQKYFENRPCTFLSDATPGNIGAWVGFRIIQKFVAEMRCTAKQLMENGNAQEVLTKSKYKP